MGVYLPKPKTEKESEDGGEFPKTGTRFGLSAMQGWRQYMEDAHIADPAFDVNNFATLGLFGVFDGHGGPAVSCWVAQQFHQIFRDELVQTEEAMRTEKIRPKNRDFDFKVAVLCEALQRTFLRLDKEMEAEQSRETLRRIHEECERRKNLEFPEEGAPRSLLDALLATVSGKRPIIQVLERGGQRLYRILPQELGQEFSSGDFDEEGETDEEDFNAKIGLESGVVEEVVDSPPERPATMEASPSGSDAAPALNNESPASSDADMDQSNGDSADNSDDAVSMTDANATNNLQPHQPECCGSTAIVAAVLGGETRYLVTANAGDSRAVLCRNGTAIALSRDHKPVLRGENRRIVNAGGKVVNGRVDGNLNLSRALGDLFYKSDAKIAPDQQKIISLPDVRVVPLSPADQFVILACDGIWDCMTNQQAADFVLKGFSEAGQIDSVKLSQICETICDSCLCANPLNSEGGIGCDNMTVIIVLLQEDVCIGSHTHSAAAQPAEPLFYGDEPEEQDYEECVSINWKENGGESSDMPAEGISPVEDGGR